MRLLVVEDDIILGESLTQRLRRSGQGVDLARSGAEAVSLIKLQPYDLVLLDLNLPDTSGEAVLNSLRRQNDTTPVLVLTARDQIEDRIQLLDAGADDYLTKPFDFGELEARMRALLRRNQGQARDQVSFGNVVLDRRACSLSVAGKPVELKSREFRLLEIFMNEPKRVWSKEALLEHIYSFDEHPNPSVIEIYVTRVRKLLQGSDIQIRTIRGLGYLLEQSK
ncbi:response regulator transcription factor [Marinobacterium mangrovicola]|uniref:Winged helix family two component transcriptional regulator n=1 Tax=Marinobacterium mangrovicola TaxID=1476959 RepID=A0A4R1GRG7_9GAMM|nr:response regulator transcription factor [Marinobacterium mangrovicola]TCK08789.1 winged helix family two component transcriptional regulator [Marinobacterium mangrovicola]